MSSELGAMMAEPGCSAAALAAPVATIAARFPALSSVVAVTTNPCAVMTTIGDYAKPCFVGEDLALIKGQTTLRIHSDAVATMLAVDRPDHGQLPWSLQFFDNAGAAMHKCFLTSLVDDASFAELTRGWLGASPRSGLIDADLSRGWMPAAPDGASWHRRSGAAQLDAVLGDAGLARRASLPSWGDDLAWRVDPDILFDLMTLLSEVRMPVSMGVGNAGFMQLHQGALDGVKSNGDAFRLTADKCAVSLDLSEVEEVWVTCFDAGGAVGHMLEIYDWRYHCVAQFSEFSRDNVHLVRFWQETLRGLPRLRSAAPARGRILR